MDFGPLTNRKQAQETIFLFVFNIISNMNSYLPILRLFSVSWTPPSIKFVNSSIWKSHLFLSFCRSSFTLAIVINCCRTSTVNELKWSDSSSHYIQNVYFKIIWLILFRYEIVIRVHIKYNNTKMITLCWLCNSFACCGWLINVTGLLRYLYLYCAITGITSTY